LFEFIQILELHKGILTFKRGR